MNSKQISVLLVEDDIDDCNFFKKAIAGIPLNIILSIINDGDQLIGFLEKNANTLPDIIFLDLSMPRKTGIESLSEVKEIDQFKQIPIVMLSTSYTMSTNFEQGLIKSVKALGAFDFVRKPDNLLQLQESISQFLNQIINLKE